MKLVKISVKEWFLIFSRVIAIFLLGSPLWVAGANMAKLANVGFIDSLPLTAVLSLVFGLEKFNIEKALFIVLSFIGVVILSVKDIGKLTSIGMGELLVLISGFFFAYRNFSRIWHTKLLNNAEITQLMLVLGFISVLLVSLFSGEKLSFINWNWNLVLVLVVGGFIMIANIYLSNYGFSKVSPIIGSNILNMEAIFAFLFGYFYFREIINLRELIGGLLILVSIVKMNKIKN